MTTARGGAATALSIVHGDDLESLLGVLAEELPGASADPFARPMVIVRNGVQRRWLTQRLATWAGPEGICAGLDMVSWPGLLARLENDVVGVHDAWRPDRLVWPVLAALTDSDKPELQLVRRHVENSPDRFRAGRRLARLMSSYGRFRPDWTIAWDDERPAGPLTASDSWQPVLWRELRQRVDSPSSPEQADRLIAALPTSPVEASPVVWWFAPELPLDPQERRVLAALAERRDVRLLVLTPTPGRSERVVAPGTARSASLIRSLGGYPLNARLQRLAWERAQCWPAARQRSVPALPRPSSLLGRLQHSIALDAQAIPGPVDDTVQVFASHGLDRQVEVLRDVLTGLLADDPTLEPRDIAVLTPRLDRIAPLVTASFNLDPDAPGAHPGHGLRAQLIERPVRQGNPLMTLLVEILRLGSSRAGVDQLLQLCGSPAIARRFGFSSDDLDRLAALTSAAAINWGVDRPHRERFGLGRVQQNTWVAGLRRMLVGISLSDDGLPVLQTTLPVDDVESSDVELLGALAELVSRLVRVASATQSEQPLAAWLDLCREIVDGLFATTFDDSWQLAEVRDALADIDPGDAAVTVAVGAVEVILEQAFEDRTSRVSFGNGSLPIGALGSLHGVPHRVVCLVGFDPDVFPRRRGDDGDDLLRRAPAIGDPDPGQVDLQRLCEAVLAAREKLVLVHQGFSPATNEPLPPASAIAELIEAVQDLVSVPAQAATIVQRAPLHAHSPASFQAGRPFSFDAVGLGAAAARLTIPPRADEAMPLLPPLPDGDVALDDVMALILDPAAALRKRAGLPAPRELADANELPIALDGLSEWKIGDRMLAEARRGEDPAAVRTAEWLRGEVPPGYLGSRVVERTFGHVVTMMRTLPTVATQNAIPLPLRLPLPGRLLTGRLELRGGEIVPVSYSRLSAKSRLSAWIQVLALQVARPDVPALARIVARDRQLVLRAPSVQRSQALLTDLVTLYDSGMREALPMPLRAAERYAGLAASGIAPDPGNVVNAVRAEWEMDHSPDWDLFYPHDRLFKIPRPDDPLLRSSEPLWFGALARRVWDPLLGAMRS